MNDIQSAAADLAETADQMNADVSEAQIRDQIEELTEYRIPLEDAVSTVRSRHELFGPMEIDAVADIDEDGEWFNLEVQVVELWEPNSDAIAQTGLIGDESGTIKFTWFDGTDLPMLEEGESYQLESVVSDLYQDRMSVKLNKATDVVELEEDIEVADRETEFNGRIVDIRDNSGLIKRCSEEDCNRVLSNGECPVHGQVEGEWDVRTIAVVDDGTETRVATFDAEATEELVGMSVEDARNMLAKNPDPDMIQHEIETETLGQRVSVTGPQYENDSSPTIFVDSFETVSGVTMDDIDNVLVRARS
ncbi:replication factor A [Salinadaptatus halalkaliphilus]|uniref:Replication factor A n=1 Tax=Salinadaptatus halalkaliphilus TaxID=2419781 RepID=A0A4S3TQ84_9EURY|nr:replication factor A [Salinadaptatus halalkaliphilus]THE65850.1 replication factor A [Salinadaptatus halalkaliphilus]